MPIQRPPSGQCIFCAFRFHTRPPTRPAPRPAPTRPKQPPAIAAQHGSFSTTSRAKRESQSERLIRKTSGGTWGKPRQTVTRRVQSEKERNTSVVQFEKFKKSRFRALILDRLEAIETKLRQTPVLQQSGQTEEDADKILANFRLFIRHNVLNDKPNITARDRIGGDGDGDGRHELHAKLFNAMRDKGVRGLDAELQYALYNYVLGMKFSREDINNQRALADLRYPTEWYQLARTMHRTVHAHIGPTNSGKTYHALKRLEEAKAGVYAGPLRLLAHEVYSRLNSKGKPCALITGEEQRLPPGWIGAEERIISATVEMTSLSTFYDVAVIDEIQMLGSLERGFAWTQAFLGLKANEIHVCGEVRALPIIRELAAAAGDKLVVHEYERLTKLEMDTASLGGSFHGLRKGDCIVTFSVVNIHALRTEVERKTGKKVAVVYGSLPPETRAQQARLFNDPDNDYDYLIASDAVGMGLNLSIKRIIFETVHKYHGGRLNTLSTSEIRQIAGRAGRYRTSHAAIQAMEKDTDAGPEAAVGDASTWKPHHENQPLLDAEEPRSVITENPSDPEATTSTQESLSTRAEFDHHTIGLVTTIDHADFDIVRRALETEPPPLTFATLQPPPNITQRFASYFPPDTPFSYILLRLTELSNTTNRYKIYHKADMIMMADLIHGIDGLSVEDRMILINAPAAIRDVASMRSKLFKELASCVGNQRGGELLDLKHIDLDVLDSPSTGTKRRLTDLEELHRGLVLYLWLSFRFPGIFSNRPLGNYVKGLVENEIEKTLKLMTFVPSYVTRERMRKHSNVEDEIMKVIREEDAIHNARGRADAGEPGFVSPGSEDVVGEERGLSQVVAKGGEQMPEDDEGEYPEEETPAAAEDTTSADDKRSHVRQEHGTARPGIFRRLLGQVFNRNSPESSGRKIVRD